MKKSRFTLWGPAMVNGVKSWGVNEWRGRSYGMYSHGPRDGYYTRRDAVAALRAARAAERREP
jgi:hypothetical protein